MVGLIHRLMLDMLRQNYGTEAVSTLMTQAGLADDQVFRLDTNYSDSEFQNLLKIVLEQTPLSQEQLESQFAVHFLKDALKRWPAFFEMSDSAKSLLEKQPRIHNGFASSMTQQADRDKINDKFHLDSSDHALTVHYKSPHQLCGLYIALAGEVLNHYREQARIEELSCLKHGDDECCIKLTWPQEERAS
ncbi:MAG: heme NO-binding domain-containing protein [Cellvibrionaceae bacterium]